MQSGHVLISHVAVFVCARYIEGDSPLRYVSKMHGARLGERSPGGLLDSLPALTAQPAPGSLFGNARLQEIPCLGTKNGAISVPRQGVPEFWSFPNREPPGASSESVPFDISGAFSCLACWALVASAGRSAKTGDPSAPWIASIWIARYSIELVNELAIHLILLKIIARDLAPFAGKSRISAVLVKIGLCRCYHFEWFCSD